ncbi:hypothetical protein H6G01_23270 [Leptolyngbya sp. FACHB-17]|nr:hypothetical protein [Leptolyngbya sp. FACHB-17]
MNLNGSETIAALFQSGCKRRRVYGRNLQMELILAGIVFTVILFLVTRDIFR